MVKKNRRRQGQRAGLLGRRSAQMKAGRARHRRELKRLTRRIEQLSGQLVALPPSAPGSSARVNDIIKALINIVGALVGEVLGVVSCLALEGQLDQANELLKNPDVDAETKKALNDLGQQLWTEWVKNC